MKFNIILKKFFVFLIITLFLLSFIKIDYRLKEINAGAISDDSSYWYHAQTIGIDLDLDYSNQLEGTNKRNLNIENNKPVPVHPIGVGIFSGPILIISNILGQLVEINTVVSFNYFIYSMIPILYIYLGLYLINVILKKKSIKINPLKGYVFLLGSGVTYFAFERFSMSHSYEFFSVIFLFYLSCLYSENSSKFIEIITPVAMFAILTLRWSNYHIFLISHYFHQIY